MKNQRAIQITGIFFILFLLAIPLSGGELIPSGLMNIDEGPSVSGDIVASIQTEDEETSGQSEVTSSYCPECQSEADSYGVMVIDEEMLKEMEEMNAIDMANSPPIATEKVAALRMASAGDKDLSTYVPYFGNDRNQGSCGNCWVFAGTGLTEVSMAVQTGVKERLSVQYVNSLFNGGTGTSWACCGGNIQYFTNFYTGTGGKKLIPWSNTGASYADVGEYCNTYPTARSASAITTTPNHPITAMSYSMLNTWSGDETAIANIKNALDNNQAVYLAFYWYDTASNTGKFQNFWSSSAETALFDPVAGVGTYVYGYLVGHAVMIIGYHDDGNGNGYWIVQNSWGTRTNHPQGTYRQDMYIDYDAVVPSTSTYVTNYYTLDVTFDESALLQPVISGINPAHGWNEGSEMVSITGDKFASGADVRLTRTGYTPIVATGVSVPSDSQITCTFTLTGKDTGSWNVVVTNPNGYTDTLENGYTINSLESNFSYWPTTGVAPLKIYFTDTSTGFPVPTSWSWDFTNDGVIDATGKSASWTYQTPGTYTVNLTVGNGLESQTVVAAIERE